MILKHIRKVEQNIGLNKLVVYKNLKSEIQPDLEETPTQKNNNCLRCKNYITIFSSVTEIRNITFFCI